MADPPLLILLDQNVPRLVAPWLGQLRPGWRIVHTSEVGLSGATDDRVFEWAQARGAIVITFDEDFADRRSFPVGTHCGVVRLRVWPTTIEVIREALERLLSTISSDAEIAGALAIISQSNVRIRRGSGPEAP